jgi:hypothetical protein
MAKAKRDIYDMKLHEIIVVNSTLSILRVSDGWIYIYNKQPVFVKYNEEFK